MAHLWKARGPRTKITGEAVVRSEGGALPCQVVDVSVGGALLAPAPTTPLLSDGARVVVELRLGRGSSATYVVDACVRLRGERLAVVFRTLVGDLRDAIEGAMLAAIEDETQPGGDELSDGVEDESSDLFVAVLVVDDDPDLRAMMVEILRDAGYAADEACDGEQALAVLHANPGRYDVIVLDVSMPRLDGRGFCAARQRDRAIASIPVVLATGEPPAACNDLPVTLILCKPVGLPTLLAAVEACVASK